MKKLIYLGLISLLVACTTPAPKDKPMDEGSSKQQVDFDRGMRAMDDQNYEDAAKIFDKLLLQKPGTEMDLVALFNSGSAYEGMGKCQIAADRFRQVVRSSPNKFTRIQSEALFHLSLCYECLGQDAKSVTALLDARKRSKDLAPEVLNAEIPARLAAAYARLGNREKALEYFNIASRGLKGIVSRGGSPTQLNTLGRTLYLMGQLSPSQRRAEVEPIGFLESLSMQQPYLLQAVEINRPPWNNKAEDDLKMAYQNIWKFKFEDNNKRREFFTRSLQTINELRKIRLPRDQEGANSIFDELSQHERLIQNELAKIGETNPLTPEAEKRGGLKQKGRLVNPESTKATKSK